MALVTMVRDFSHRAATRLDLFSRVDLWMLFLFTCVVSTGQLSAHHRCTRLVAGGNGVTVPAAWQFVAGLLYNEAPVSGLG